MSVSETNWTERSVDRVICIDRSEVVLEQVEHVAGVRSREDVEVDRYREEVEVDRRT